MDLIGEPNSSGKSYLHKERGRKEVQWERGNIKRTEEKNGVN